VARDNDKNPVVALREISENSINISGLRDNLIKSFQRHVFVENHESELDDEVQESIDSVSEWDEEMAAVVNDDVSGDNEINLDSDDEESDEEDLDDDASDDEDA
jgi:DNA-directed RNA polymerase subunit omega